jgi:hypothetical protein
MFRLFDRIPSSPPRQHVGNAAKGSTDLASTVQFHLLDCSDADISIGRPKFSVKPTENVRLHGIGLDDDFFNMGTFTALECAHVERCARW